MKKNYALYPTEGYVLGADSNLIYVGKEAWQRHCDRIDERHNDIDMDTMRADIKGKNPKPVSALEKLLCGITGALISDHLKDQQ